MKTQSLFLFLALAFSVQPLALHAQGSLAPPGAPTPTMKTLNQIEPRTPISSLPYSINNPGSYYITTNLTGSGGANGITINTGNVAIDLCGFTLQGVPGSSSGIAVANTYTNLVFRNGIVTGWGNNGVDAYSVGFPRNILIEKITASDNNSDGIIVEADSIIRDCLSVNNRFDGIYTDGGQIIGCVARANGNHGIYAVVDSRVRDCLVQYNTNGIYADHSVVEDSDISRNYVNGIVVQSACRIVNNRIADQGNISGDAILIQGQFNYIAENSILNDAFGLNGGGAAVTNNCIVLNRFLQSSQTVINPNNIFPMVEIGNLSSANFYNTNSLINIVYP
jgi:hypothetical protein